MQTKLEDHDGLHCNACAMERLVSIKTRIACMKDSSWRTNV
jgi:hypothetical protein